MNDISSVLSLSAQNLQQLVFEPFREGVTAHWLRHEFPQLALPKYEPGATVPLHLHTGLETIFVLSGDQTDERGTITEGDFAMNIPGSQHSVSSKDGCLVLLQWEKPIQFIEC
jgi:anti-sigma factor ChrR (cupin superfamily)